MIKKKIWGITCFLLLNGPVRTFMDPIWWKVAYFFISDENYLEVYVFLRVFISYQMAIFLIPTWFKKSSYLPFKNINRK